MKITWSYSVKVNGKQISRHGGEIAAKRKAKRVGGVVTKRDWRAEMADQPEVNEPDVTEPGILIESSGYTLGSTAFYRASRGQKYWWLKDEDNGDFITIAKTSGRDHFEERLDLEDSTYTLGTGSGRGSIRETIVIKDGKVARQDAHKN